MKPFIPFFEVGSPFFNVVPLGILLAVFIFGVVIALDCAQGGK